MLRETSSRLVRLVTDRIHAAASELGGRVDTVMVSETLVCLRGAVTTEKMRATIDADAGVLHPYGEGAEVVVMTAPYKAVATPRGPADRGGFLIWYVLGLAAVLMACASDVAELEAAACAGLSCFGRPATYWQAVRWLADQAAFFLGSSDLAPVTTRAWVFGWLMRFAGLTGVLVAIVAVRQFMSHARRPLDELTRVTGDQMRPIVLVLVVKHNERTAVMAAVHAVNATKPRKEFRGQDTVWALGSVGGADVLLAHGPEQGGHGPNGMTTFAGRLMVTCDPDYVILTGICYGLQEQEQQIGDILVSQRLHDIDRQRLMDSRRIASGHYVPASGLLLSRFNAAVDDRPMAANVHFGLMLGSNSLFDSPDRRAWLKHEYPEAIGGEMEGESVYSVAADSKVDWIVVKAIADWGASKTVDHQYLAVRNAAEFVVHTISSGGFDIPRTRTAR